MLAAAFSFALVLADYQYRQLATVRAVLGSIAGPIYQLTNAPIELKDWLGERFSSRSELQEENARLRSESLVLKAKLQKQAALASENGRLRALLKSSALIEGGDVTVAEMVGVVSVPGRHEVFINKGASDKVYVGQPVLDSEGLMGQVVAVNLFTSQVILVTDASHSVPVQVSRSGMRGIAEGLGRYDRLEMPNVPLSADIRVGDILESSGLGQRFPAGYPVAQVSAIKRSPGKPFLTVQAQPLAQLDRSRHLLLVSSSQQG